jgi:WD40 repeat protein
VKGIIDYPISSISLLSNRYQALVASTEGSTIHLLDLKMNKTIEKYEHKDFFNTSATADITPSESYVLAGNCDGGIYYWDRYKGKMVKKITGHDSAVSTLKYHFMSGILVSADKEGSIILWQ